MRTLAVALGSLLAVVPIPASSASPDPAPPSIEAPRPDAAPAPAPHRHRMWGRRPGWAGPLTVMLRHQADLGLSAEQVQKLEQLRFDFRRDAIRRVADLRIAELDLSQLRRADQADLVQVETKLRDIERLRADLRLAAIRTAETGKAQLTADQRAKLRTLFEARRPRAWQRPAAPTSGETPPQAAATTATGAV